jgi:hypothetical protein
MTTIQQQARRAGRLYFLLGLLGPIGLIIVPTRLIVSGDAAATADRIRASEWLFRVGIGSEILSQVLVIFLVTAFYRLFKPVSRNLALQVMVLGAFISVPICFVGDAFSLSALAAVKGAPFLSAFDRAQQDSLAYLLLRLHSQCLLVAEVYWGLWLYPVGMLVVRSGFIPRFIGYLLFVAGAAYIVDASVSILLPQYAGAINNVTGILFSAELAIIFWLLIWGANGPRAQLPVDGPAKEAA